MKFANVFRREGQPCPRCGTTIAKLRVAGRGTHICPNCQRLQAAQRSNFTGTAESIVSDGPSAAYFNGGGAGVQRQTCPRL